MAQIHKVAKYLRRNNQGKGVTASQIAKFTGVPRDSVMKRISDLRVVEGKTIYSNVRMVNGQRKIYYRIAG